MAITDQRARERYDAMRQDIEAARRMIEWLVPFLNAKAKESGDVAGLQRNALDLAKEIQGRLNFFDAEDKVHAKELSA